MEALPPQTPTPPAIYSGQSDQAHSRYWDGNRELVVYLQGQVKTRGDADLEFGPGSSLRMEVISPTLKMTLYWDVNSCRVSGAHTGNCNETDRRTAVSVLKQQPTPPTPPRG
ncbi:hypothetical protein FG002_014390 [Chitinimonas sp. BJB300]|nr:hypothetical protein FG002_014390 [Chitinimonas sp. BJB300]